MPEGDKNNIIPGVKDEGARRNQKPEFDEGPESIPPYLIGMTKAERERLLRSTVVMSAEQILEESKRAAAERPPAPPWTPVDRLTTAQPRGPQAPSFPTTVAEDAAAAWARAQSAVSGTRVNPQAAGWDATDAGVAGFINTMKTQLTNFEWPTKPVGLDKPKTEAEADGVVWEWDAATEKAKLRDPAAYQELYITYQNQLSQARQTYATVAGTVLSDVRQRLDLWQQTEQFYYGERTTSMRHYEALKNAYDIAQAQVTSNNLIVTKQIESAEKLGFAEMTLQNNRDQWEKAIADGNLAEAVRRNKTIEGLEQRRVTLEEQNTRWQMLGTMLQQGGLAFFTLAMIDPEGAQNLYGQLLGRPATEAVASPMQGVFAEAERLRAGEPSGLVAPSIQEMNRMSPMERLRTQALFQGVGRDVGEETVQLTPREVSAQRIRRANR